MTQAMMQASAETLRTIRLGDEGSFSVDLATDPVDRFTCTTLLRCLPAKRLTCLGHWHGEAVVAKLFIDRRRASVHWRRELEGAKALERAAIAAPALRYAGPMNAGYVVIYQYLEGGISFFERWEAVSDTERPQLLEQLVKTLAQHHRRGITQGDLHLNNFYLWEGHVYTLDGADIRARPGPLSGALASDNLARLLAQLYPVHDALVERLLSVYQAVYGVAGMASAESLRRRIRFWRRRRRDQYLAKIFRSCSGFVCDKSWRRYSVYDRRWDSQAFRALIADPDRFVNSGQMLKRGNTCTVARTELAGQNLVIKRYNIKNWRHGLNRSIRPSRAAVSWRNAHRLRFYGIATPQPVALIEERWGPLRGRAYFISVYAGDVDCQASLSAPDCQVSERNRIVDQTVALLAALQKLGISHGDLKATNFLVQPTQVLLIDLDALQEHRWRWFFQKCWRRDLTRFCRNWAGDSVPGRLVRSQLAQAGLV